MSLFRRKRAPRLADRLRAYPADRFDVLIDPDDDLMAIADAVQDAMPPTPLPADVRRALVADLAADCLTAATNWDIELAALIEREGKQ